MRRFVQCVTVVVAVALLVSCSDDKSTTPTVDTIAPAAVADLVVSDSMGATLHVQWTATGDDGTTGTATGYDIRIATEPLTGSNWDDATGVSSPPTPGAAGTAQAADISQLTWWSRYYVGVRVVDEAGNWSAISNIAAGTPYPDPDWRFLIQTNGGITAVDMDWNTSVFTASAKWVEIMDNHVYTGASSLAEYDFEGNLTRTIPLPDGIHHYGFAALPGGRFAMLSHRYDSVYFVDDAGNRIATTGMLPEPDDELQMMNGVVVGNDLIISEDGSNHLLRANLSTYEITPFRDFTAFGGWLGAIDYADGHYCLCQSQNIWHFDGEGEPAQIAHLEEGSITGAVMAGGYTFVVVNSIGSFFRVNNTTGDVDLLVDDLGYPQDLALMRR